MRSTAFALALVLFWTQLQQAVADAMQDSARLGQAAARQSLSKLPLPSVNPSGDTLTLFPGTSQSLDIPVQELFPGAGSGSSSSFTDLYGRDAAAVSAGLAAQSNLKTESSSTGEAYRTLIKSSNRSHPDLSNDPVWGATDYVVGNYALFAQSFADCTSTTVFKDSQFSARLPDYKTCIRGPDPPPNCTGKRQFAVSQETAEVKLGTVGQFDVSFSFDLRNGTGSWWSDIGAGGKVVVPRLDYDKICDGSGAYKVRAVKTIGWTDSGLWGSDGGVQVDDSVSQGISQLPSCANGLVGQFWQHDVGDGDWVMAAKLYFSIEKIDSDSWQWSNAHCPELVNAIEDRRCGNTVVQCANDPGQYDATRQDKCFQYNGVRICESDLGAPPLENISKTCTAIDIQTDCDLGGSSAPCWTDIDGVRHCPNQVVGQTQTCKALESKGCGFIRSECVEGTIGSVTGTCYLFKDVYDCGITSSIPTTERVSKQACSGPIRCMGEDCIAIDRQQSRDFTRAVAALNAAQQATLDAACETEINYQQGQGFPFTTCRVFKGKAQECKRVGGLITFLDCCNAPTSLGLGAYIDLLTNISQLDNAVKGLDAGNVMRASYETLRDPLVDAWSEVAKPFVDTYSDIAADVFGSTSDIAKEGLVDGMKTLLLREVASWVGDTFGAAAGNLLFSAGGAEAFSANGQLSSAAQSGGLQLGGGGAVIGTALSVIMIAYTIYVIVDLVVNLIWECEQAEYELAAKKELRTCVYLGSYCKSKNELGVCLEDRESYCCFSSPLARILQEQVRPQLGMTFGDKKNPDCSGIPIESLAKVDWNQVNLDEWIAILQETNRLPSAANAAQKLNLEKLTGQGSRFNVDGTRLDTLERNTRRMDQLDVPSIRSQSESQGWSSGPKP
ncbi:MAG TPA: conjugal transfer mating pair stabilization protein TraN [Phycisphaerae bacterium]|nr:conjugal transfer mating pair stabilization protein TraN [Phycisphaerae bacterium]